MTPSQRILIVATAILGLFAASAQAANVPSLTGRPQKLEDQQRDTVLKTALRQRNNLPVAQGNGRRLGARRQLRKWQKSFRARRAE